MPATEVVERTAKDIVDWRIRFGRYEHGGSVGVPWLLAKTADTSTLVDRVASWMASGRRCA